MDKLLGAFTKEYINKLNKTELQDLEKLLDIDDDNLYNFFKGSNTDIKFEDNKINLLFKNYKYNGE